MGNVKFPKANNSIFVPNNTPCLMFNDNDDFNEDDFEFDGSIEDLIYHYEQLKNGLSSRYLDEEEYEFLIEYFYQEGKEQKALDVCEFALVHFPYAKDILILKADLLYHAQKYGQALLVLDQIESLDCNNLDVVLLRSDIFLAQYKEEAAAAYLISHIDNFEGKERIDILLELANVYDLLSEFEKLVETLVEVLEIDIRNDEALHKISFWADFADLQERSIEIHTKILDKDPYNKLAWFNLGVAYQGLKMYEKSIDAYAYCISIDECFEFAYRNMAEAQIRLKQYNSAIESLKRNLEIGKPEDIIFEAIGHCFEKKKDFNTARHYYRQAIKLSPNDDEMFYKIGLTYTWEKEWEKALKAYSVALHLDNENPSYFLAMGKCLLQLNENNEAVICFAKAVKLKPENKNTWLALIKSLFVSVLYDEMLDNIDLAIETLGNKPEFDFLKSLALFELGNSKEALLYLENGLITAPAKVKLITDLNRELLQRKSVVELISKYKKRKNS